MNAVRDMGDIVQMYVEIGAKLNGRIAELEAALAALIDAIDAKDSKAIESALFVGRGLTF